MFARAVLTAVAVGMLAGCLPSESELQKASAAEIPPEYSRLTNPLRDNPAARVQGGVLYQQNCASCHGVKADGHGPAAVGLLNKPINFRDGKYLAEHNDAFLFWRISEGKPTTPMPKWKGVLDESERWALVAYLRSLDQPL